LVTTVSPGARSLRRVQRSSGDSTVILAMPCFGMNSLTIVGTHSSCRSLKVPTLKPSGMFFISPILCPIIPFTPAFPAASISL
jgi:hypothetical protein